MDEIINTNDFLIYKKASGELERSPVIIRHNKTAKDISLLDPNTGEILGSVMYTDINEINNKKMLKFEKLQSNIDGKGIGTKLILELTKISKELGANGALTSEASPLPNPDAKVKKPLTNMLFYYKCGFQAKIPELHNKIKELLAAGKDIPLGLNVLKDIELSKEAATALEQKAIAQQQAFEKQQIQKATENLQQQINSQNDAKKIELINKKLIDKLDFHDK